MQARLPPTHSLVNVSSAHMSLAAKLLSRHGPCGCVEEVLDGLLNLVGLSQVDPKALARQKAQEAREEKQKAQIKRETAGMKTMSSFFSRK